MAITQPTGTEIKDGTIGVVDLSATGTPGATNFLCGDNSWKQVPIGSGVSGLATGIGTFLATPSSANLAAAVTDETGTGALVFGTSPTFVTPVLGTPASGNLANCTFPTLNQSTTGSAATLTTPRSIYGNNFDGSAALAQIIASTYGGTGNGFTKFSGPATAEKTFTLPNASATVLTDNAAVTVAQGGTGLTSLTANRIPYATATNTLGTSGNLIFDGLHLGIGGTPTYQLDVTGSDANMISLRIHNGSASGSTPDAFFGMMGATGFGVAGWPSAFLLEGEGDGGLVLGAYAASAPILFQVNGRTEAGRIASTKQLKMAAGLGLFGVTGINTRPTTAYAAAAFVANTGTAVNDASTFGGYTIKQIVQVLQDYGLLT